MAGKGSGWSRGIGWGFAASVLSIAGCSSSHTFRVKAYQGGDALTESLPPVAVHLLFATEAEANEYDHVTNKAWFENKKERLEQDLKNEGQEKRLIVLSVPAKEPLERIYGPFDDVARILGWARVADETFDKEKAKGLDAQNLVRYFLGLFSREECALEVKVFSNGLRLQPLQEPESP